LPGFGGTQLGEDAINVVTRFARQVVFHLPEVFKQRIRLHSRLNVNSFHSRLIAGAPLEQAVSGSPTQAEVQALADKLNELINRVQGG
jgi:hypothetical protein